VKKTIKNYCFNATQSKLNELYEIGQRYVKIKNEVFHRYGSVEGLKYLSYPRQIRDEWVETGYADRFNLQVRYWKQAFDEAFSNISSNWSNRFNSIRKNLYKNKNYTEDERHYAFYLLKATDLLYKTITFQDFNLPDKFQDMNIRRDKIHKYLKSRLRNHTGNKPYQSKGYSFQIDSNMYDYYKDNKGRLWIGIMGLTPRKRIRLQMTSSIEPSGSLRVVLKRERVEIHNAVDVEVKKWSDGEVRAIDKGFKQVITSSSGKKYGEGFNELLKDESNRLSKKNKNRNKLYALIRKHEERGSIVEAEIIRKNNLGKKKYNHLKEREGNRLKDFINLALNQFFAAEEPSTLVIEDLTYNRVWNRKLSKVVRRYLSSWLRGYLQERLNYKTMLNGVQQVVVNPAYGSQICHICGRFGLRR